MLALFSFARTSRRWQKQHCLFLTGLSFGSLSGKILITSDQEIELPPDELEYNPHLPTIPHGDLGNLGSFTSGDCWQDAASSKAFQNPREWLCFPAPQFSSSPDSISRSVLCFTCKHLLPLPGPSWLIHAHVHTHARVHTQTSHKSAEGQWKVTFTSGFPGLFRCNE